MPLDAVLDLIAVFVFALTGGIVASRAQLDIVGFLFLGCLTGVGGGTLRDLLLGRAPVFWVASPHYMGVACAAAMLTFFTAHRLESRYNAILWLDALALPVAVAAGVGIARDSGASWPIVLIMGVATGTFGGLMRDVVANEIPLVLRQGDLYVSACLAGALTSVLLLHLLPAHETLSLMSASGVTFLLRAGSLQFGWRLPVYKARPPKTISRRSALDETSRIKPDNGDTAG
ncbi:trimeric intracellular cation channel family protein [Oryzicola mucosus]|uniref:Trimeric intracellular cation channel family protein n=1 Tax=Oryzicola mucosus TaxID=2767425 RepID=A0A8J6U1J5_9HYPH|nr:trimeric intracellular cation channel family protein [Oryzicola mucosus]MBD0417026.1 trimeric intracellular cation channel family protein [Oryzicola mucosus]